MHWTCIMKLLSCAKRLKSFVHHAFDFSVWGVWCALHCFSSTSHLRIIFKNIISDSGTTNSFPRPQPAKQHLDCLCTSGESQVEKFLQPTLTMSRSWIHLQEQWFMEWAPGRRNRTPACLHAPWVEVMSEHQPDSPWPARKLKKSKSLPKTNIPPRSNAAQILCDHIMCKATILLIVAPNETAGGFECELLQDHVCLIWRLLTHSLASQPSIAKLFQKYKFKYFPISFHLWKFLDTRIQNGFHCIGNIANVLECGKWNKYFTSTSSLQRCKGVAHFEKSHFRIIGKHI